MGVGGVPCFPIPYSHRVHTLLPSLLPLPLTSGIFVASRDIMVPSSKDDRGSFRHRRLRNFLRLDGLTIVTLTCAVSCSSTHPASLAHGSTHMCTTNAVRRRTLTGLEGQTDRGSFPGNGDRNLSFTDGHGIDYRYLSNLLGYDTDCLYLGLQHDYFPSLTSRIICWVHAKEGRHRLPRGCEPLV